MLVGNAVERRQHGCDVVHRCEEVPCQGISEVEARTCVFLTDHLTPEVGDRAETQMH